MNFEEINKSSKFEENMNMNNTQSCCMGMNNPQMMDGMCPPIYECPEERVCHRYMCYEVPHIKPCNTRIINHHIYRHTFTPVFSACEENVFENVYDRKCC